MKNNQMKDTEKQKQHKNQTIYFKNKPVIIGSYCVAGPKEGKGPLGKQFHKVLEDDYFGEKSHERAERKMFELTIKSAIKKAGKKESDIEILFAGDLLNQIISSSFAARSMDTMFLGLYGACSTMALSLVVGSMTVNAGYFDCVACATGSHFATAERQYRFPLELGSQKPPLSQWTVTGTGCAVLARKGIGPCVTSATIGKVIDYGINDANNMGAAMAPAAFATLCSHFVDTNTTPKDYDAIFTGDLGKLGSNILRDLMLTKGYDLGQHYNDCGHMVFDGTQHSYQGGSGCGCSGLVLNSFIMDKFKSGLYKKVLFCATGALMSPTSADQGETIPCVAHAVVIEKGE